MAEQRVESGLRGDPERLRVLADLAAQVAGTLDVAEVKQRAVQSACRLMHCEAASLLLHRPDSRKIAFDVAAGGVQNEIHRFSLEKGEGIAGHVVETGEPYWTNDVASDARHSARIDEALNFETRQLLAVPVRTSAGVIGCLQVLNPEEPPSFGEEDVGLLEALANLVAVALENARLHQEVAARTEEVRRQHQALIEAEKLTAMGQLSAGVAHEIRSPLSAISGYAQLIRRRGADEKILRPIRTIEDAASHINRIVNGLLDMARKDEPRYERVYVRDVLQSAFEMLGATLERYKGVTLVQDLTPDLPTVSADVRQLRQVFVNLMLNAAQAMPNGGTLTVETFGEPPAGHEDSGVVGRVVILFRDTGEGISSDDVDKVFQPFFTAGKEGGSGLGLSFCRSIVQNHRGGITFETEAGIGTVFRVHLPVDPAPDL